MSDQGSPTVRRRRLAAELHRLRERSGLTGDQVAERLGWSPSKISRIENTRSGLKLADARKLLDLYGVYGHHREQLFELAREAGRRGWWEIYAADLPEGFADFIGMEAEAKSAWNWEPQVVPGLLQTEAYARGVLQSWDKFVPIPPETIDRRVEARIARQQVLTREDPLELSIVLDESVLLRHFTSERVMRAQLEQLIECSELPNVRLQVLQFRGPHTIGTGAFAIFHFSQAHEVKVPDVVWVEHLTSSFYIKETTDIHYYKIAFEYLLKHSLDPVQSRDLIAKAAREEWRL